jgi:predicted metal-dependent hydrolase
MASKQVTLPQIGLVYLYKRRGSRAIRISFSHKGDIRVTLPYYVPYQAAIAFAINKSAWINEHRPEAAVALRQGDRIGKAHRIHFETRELTSPRATISQNRIVVAYSAVYTPQSPSVQKAAERAALRALKKEAEALLPRRLGDLAKAKGYAFKDVRVKQLKSRWGSCNQHGEITLNYYLMQLPWQLIDYVLLHELTHTEHLDHSAAFWERLERALPGSKQIKKSLRTFRPIISPA